MYDKIEEYINLYLWHKIMTLILLKSFRLEIYFDKLYSLKFSINSNIGMTQLPNNNQTKITRFKFWHYQFYKAQNKSIYAGSGQKYVVIRLRYDVSFKAWTFKFR